MTEQTTAIINDDAGHNEQDEVLELTPEMDAFFKRADHLINVANEQLSKECHTGQVGASLIYASARYAAFSASVGFKTSEDYLAEKDKMIEYYSKQFAQMLSDNVDDYAKNFDKYTEL